MPLTLSEYAKTSRADAYHPGLDQHWLDFALRADHDFDIERELRAPQREEIAAVLQQRGHTGLIAGDELVGRIAAQIDLHPWCVKLRLREMGYEVAGIDGPCPRKTKAGKQDGFCSLGRRTYAERIRVCLAAGPKTVKQIADATGIQSAKVRKTLVKHRGRLFVADNLAKYNVRWSSKK